MITKTQDFKLRAKTRMLERGLTVVALARKLKRSRTAVSVAINHPTMHPKIKERVAKTLDIPV